MTTLTELPATKTCEMLPIPEILPPDVCAHIVSILKRDQEIYVLVVERPISAEGWGEYLATVARIIALDRTLNLKTQREDGDLFKAICDGFYEATLDNDTTADEWVEKLREHYQGYDYIEDGLDIANLICNGEANEGMADRLITAMGFALGAVIDIPTVSPETLAKAKRIRQIALPGIDAE